MTRKQMISTLRGMSFGMVIGSKGDEALRMAISALEQEPICDKDCEHCTWTECPVEPCEDAISREDALKQAKASYRVAESFEELANLYEQNLKSLPSVQPSRKGHWILADNPNPKIYADKYVCSECGADVIGTTEEYNFCPNCGADMRGAE